NKDDEHRPMRGNSRRKRNSGTAAARLGPGLTSSERAPALPAHLPLPVPTSGRAKCPPPELENLRMQHLGPVQSEYGIEHHGITNVARVFWNLSASSLVEESVRRGEGLLSADGALVVNTGKHTGRSPNDKFIVEEPTSKDKINWGKVNR